MKLYVLSDLHNEFSRFDPPGELGDVVVLAGDIATKTRGVEWANTVFTRPVIYVAGNHEYYGGHLDQTLAKIRAVALPHVHVLDNQVFVWGQTRFLCTTAWTDFTSTGNSVAAMQAAWSWMNDLATGACARLM